MFGGICGDCERGREIGEVKDRLGSKRGFQGGKGIVTRAVPGPGISLLGEVKKGAGSVSVTFSSSFTMKPLNFLLKP